MNILLIHSSFPAQFRYLAQALAKSDKHEVVFITSSSQNSIEGLRKIVYETEEEINYRQKTFERAQNQGIRVFEKTRELLSNGFKPDVIYAHAGYGVSMFIKQMLPQTPMVSYFEWFFDPTVNIFAEYITDNQMEFMREAQAVNAVTLLDLSAADLIIAPTLFQKQQLPKMYESKTLVMHDGIDTQLFHPPADKIKVRNDVLKILDITVPEQSPLVTYVSRGMEPLRGFPEFVQALSEAQKRQTDFHTLIVGSENPHYGPSPQQFVNYKEKLWKQVDLDLSRIHFTGLIPTDVYAKVLRISDLHIYLTRSFVLSWSALEAMASGCRIIASDTHPVSEFMQNNIEALLVPFNNFKILASTIIKVLEEIEKDADHDITFRKKARKKIVKNYSLKKMLPRQISMLQAISNY